MYAGPSVRDVDLAASPVETLPRTLPHWRWAGLVYVYVVKHWPFTRSCRRTAALAKEYIRTRVVAAIETGEHWDVQATVSERLCHD